MIQTTKAPSTGSTVWMILADLGAEILRIEAPNRADLTRQLPPFDGGVSAQHAVLNRSKRSLALDLKQPGATDIVKRLIQQYDIIIEQFRPGVMDRLGVGFDALHAINEQLIFCSLTGYGQDGPYANRAGHDLNYLALAGLLSYTGRTGETPPPMPIQVADVGAGSLFCVVGLLAAYIRRQHTGQGGHVDISMYDGALAWNNLGVATTVVGGTSPEQEGTILNGGSFYDCYRTADDRFLSIGSLEPKFWAGFCTAIDRTDLIVQGSNLADRKAQQAVKSEITKTIAQKTLAAWTAIFAEIDVCVEPVLTTAEALEHPQTPARNMLVHVPRPDGTQQPQVGTPIKMTSFVPVYEHIGVAQGAHSEAVLREMGFTAEEIAGLIETGVIAIA